MRRPGYQELADVELRTAVRDLNQLVDDGLLAAEGATRGRHYRSTPKLDELAKAARAGAAVMADPFPALMAQIAAHKASVSPSSAGPQPEGSGQLTTVSELLPFDTADEGGA